MTVVLRWWQDDDRKRERGSCATTCQDEATAHAWAQEAGLRIYTVLPKTTPAVTANDDGGLTVNANPRSGQRL